MADYIIQKAVEVSKVKKKLQKTLAEYGEQYDAYRKYDGCCAILRDRSTFSRTGEVYECLNDIADYLHYEYPDFVFIGEAWWPGKGEFNLISGEFRRIKVSDRLMFIIHDIIPADDFHNGVCNIGYKDRMADWGHLDCQYDGRIQLAQGWAKGTIDPQEKCNELVAEGGYDGLVLRDPAGTWTAGSGTTGEIIKVKQKLSFDLRVLEVNTAVGEKTGRTVYKLVVDYQGRRLGVGSGVPHLHADVPVVGDIVEIEAMDYSSDGLLREPRFKGVRFDKTEPDAG